ncbi:MAG: hypothetical protein J5802_05635 [Butyrivibrio sp.]|nr:hypothetical protein [Butyrivibrio sp.]
MKKSISTIIVSSALVLALMGCGRTETEVIAEDSQVTDVDAEEKESSNEDSEASEVATDSASTGEDAFFVYNGKEVSIVDDVPAILEALGEADSELTGKYDEGGYYGYSGGDIYFNTYIVDGVESPNMLSIHSADVKTSRNIGVGDPAGDVIAAYGEPKELSDSEETEEWGIKVYEYDFGDFMVDFQIEDDKVSDITYMNAKVRAILEKKAETEIEGLGDE